jgi:hypothetical protein
MTIDEIRALLAEATPGPWTVMKRGGGWGVVNQAGDAELGNWLVADCWWRQDADAIAAAPTIAAIAITQADLLAAAQEEIERLRKALMSVFNCLDNGLDKLAYNIAREAVKEPKP